MMTRQHFEAIASIIEPHISENSGAIRLSAMQLAINFAEYLKTTNPQFNKRRFLNACGVPNIYLDGGKDV